MVFLLFGFWVLLNGKWTLEIGAVGVVVCLALYAFMCAYMGYSPKKEWKLVKRLPRIAAYGLYLVCEVYKAAFDTIKLIWAPDKEVEPRLTTFRTRLKTDAGKVVLANSITMTPGTITVDMQDDVFLVHCLDRSFDMGQEGFDMETRIMGIEGRKHHPVQAESPFGTEPVLEGPMTEPVPTEEAKEEEDHV